MITIIIIGSGNAAQHLITAFSISQEIEIVQVFARNKAALLHRIDNEKIVSDYKLIKTADLYVIAVSDDSIQEVSNQLQFENRLVVHTSGAASIERLNNKNRKGVFYPLQTFSKNKNVDFKTIPICLEANNDDDSKLLSKVANAISTQVFNINSEQRKALHVAAVFVSNFTNYMYSIGSQICLENDIPFEILLPLIQETAKKLEIMSPTEAQTGPAKRGDSQTIKSHLAFLSAENQRNIYELLTQSIIENGKKL